MASPTVLAAAPNLAATLLLVVLLVTCVRGQGPGGDPGAAPGPPSDAGHVDLGMEVTPGGEVRITRASERPGRPRTSPLPFGAYAVEVARGGEALLVEPVPDPFEAHSFGGGREHRGETLERGDVKVRIPGVLLEDLRPGRIDPTLTVRLLYIEEAGLVQRLDPEALADWRRQGRVEVVAEIGGEELAAGIAPLVSASP